MDARSELLKLLDRLDDLVHNAKSVPLTGEVRLDREEVYDVLDQMRAVLPDAVGDEGVHELLLEIRDGVRDLREMSAGHRPR